MIRFLKGLSSSKKRPSEDNKNAADGTKTERGILIFQETGQVIRAETALKKIGLKISVKAPPPALRTGCDLIIEFPLLHSPAVLKTLSDINLKPLQLLPVSDGLLEPVSVFQHKDYGDYLMVRAANMKICIEKQSGLIVNVSGGGCPDVPYLARQLVGTTLDKAIPPLENGQTLCGYALQLAFDEAKRCIG